LPPAIRVVEKHLSHSMGGDLLALHVSVGLP
jgi:hypothetical protein